MNTPPDASHPARVERVEFVLDGRAVSAAAGQTLLEVALREGAQVPHLCHCAGLAPAGHCRACLVEIDGEALLAPACCRVPTAGMAVATRSARARRAQKAVLGLLLADHPENVYTTTLYTPDDELAQWAARLGLAGPRFAPRAQPPADQTHAAIAVNRDACIQCTRCLRACRDAGHTVIGLALRGADARIVFDLDDTLADSACVACGACVRVCPTGALAARTEPSAPVDAFHKPNSLSMIDAQP